MKKIVKKVIVFTLIIIILYNSFIFQQQKYCAYADVLVLPGLTAKMLACLLAALGIYAASEIDYIELYNVAIEKFEEVKYLGVLARNTIVNRVIPNVQGYYENIMEWIQSFDINEWFTDITIGTTGSIPVQGVPISSGEIRVNLTGDSQVLQLGGTFVKAERRTFVEWPCYDIYWKEELDGGWIELGYIDGSELILQERDSWDDFILYDVYYYNVWLESEEYANFSIGVPLEYEPVDSIPGESIDVSLRKYKDIGLESEVIGVLVDGYYTGEYDTWQDYLDYLNDISSVDYYWLQRLLDEYDVNYTDVITPDIGLERVHLDELEDYPAIPGVDNPIDIPLDPAIPGDIPVVEIDIPDDQVLNEPIPEDTVVPGIGLIIRLLKFIGNALKVAIVTPVNVVKEGVLSLYDVVREIPGYIGGVIDTVRGIPGQIGEVVGNWFGQILDKLNRVFDLNVDWSTWWNNVLEKIREIAEKLGTIPGEIAEEIDGLWTDVKMKVGEIAENVVALPGEIAGAIDSLWTDVKMKVGEIADYVVTIPGEIAESIEGVMEDVKVWFEGLLVPTLEIDLSPLQVGTIKEKFPFSLPWDMQRIIDQLLAVPEIPRWTVEILGEELVIDFAVFEPLAKIVRWAVTIMFVIGLIKFYLVFL